MHPCSTSPRPGRCRRLTRLPRIVALHPRISCPHCRIRMHTAHAECTFPLGPYLAPSSYRSPPCSASSTGRFTRHAHSASSLDGFPRCPASSRCTFAPQPDPMTWTCAVARRPCTRSSSGRRTPHTADHDPHTALDHPDACILTPHPHSAYWCRTWTMQKQTRCRVPHTSRGTPRAADTTVPTARHTSVWVARATGHAPNKCPSDRRMDPGARESG